jgi:hypothetical protein
MSTADFLKKEAKTPFCEMFLVAGVVCRIQTNSESILAAARDSFLPLKSSQPVVELHLRLWVDPEGTTQPPWPKPYFRGLRNLVFGGFDSQSSVMVDLTSRRIMGRFSPRLAADSTYWRRVIFPRLITAVGSSIGVTELHCGCVAWNGDGLLLFGAPGAGKSTLTLALARLGFALVSEDWTYFSQQRNQLLSWGLPTGVKLLPDALRHFPELSRFQPGITLNGEEAYQIDPERDFGVSRARSCQPRWLIFLDRGEASRYSLGKISAAEAESRLSADLLAQTPEVRVSQLETIKKLVGPGCWRLRYGGAVQPVAASLARFCLGDTRVTGEFAAD